MGSKKTIAIVDDHILIAQAIKGIIANFEDFETICECENGQELIDKINTYNVLPDIVLLDISMPVMDGFAVMEGLKTSTSDDYLPVIVLTAQPGNRRTRGGRWPRARAIALPTAAAWRVDAANLARSVAGKSV